MSAPGRGLGVSLLSAFIGLVINPGWVLCGAEHLPFPGSRGNRNTRARASPSLKGQGSSALVIDLHVPVGRAACAAQQILRQLAALPKCFAKHPNDSIDRGKFSHLL